MPLVAFVVVVVYLASPIPAWGSDARLSIPTAASIVEAHTFTLDRYNGSEHIRRHYANVALDGHHYDYFPWANALWGVPVVAAWDVASRLSGAPTAGELVRSGRDGRLNVLAGALAATAAAVLMGLLAARTLELSVLIAGRGRLWPWRRALAIAAAALCTPLWSTASKGLWQHGPSMALLAGALLTGTYAWGRSGRPVTASWVLAGALLGASAWSRPTNAVAAAVCAGVLVLWQRRGLVGAVAGFVLTAALGMVVSVSIYGGTPPYFAEGRLGIHPRLAEAVAAQVVSPARGVLVYTPWVVLCMVPLLLPMMRRSALGRAARIALVAVGGYALAAGAYKRSWWAGHSYGPRFMSEALVFALPVAFAVTWFLVAGVRSPDAAPGGATQMGAPPRPRWWLRTAVVAPWVLSGVLGFQGAWVPGASCSNDGPPDIDVAPQRAWSPASIMWGFTVVARDGWAQASRQSCPMPV